MGFHNIAFLWYTYYALKRDLSFDSCLFLPLNVIGILKFKVYNKGHSVADPEGVRGFARTPLWDQIISFSWGIIRKLG